jgi:hypothetical protein
MQLFPRPNVQIFIFVLKYKMNREITTPAQFRAYMNNVMRNLGRSPPSPPRRSPLRPRRLNFNNQARNKAATTIQRHVRGAAVRRRVLGNNNRFVYVKNPNGTVSIARRPTPKNVLRKVHARTVVNRRALQAYINRIRGLA